MNKITLLAFITCIFLFSYKTNAQTDITNNGGVITAQYNNSNAAENYPKVIDNSTSTKYYYSATALWIRYQSTASAVVTSYRITSANDVPTRDPRNWTFQGSNDGTNWTTLNTQTNQTFSSRFLTRTFSFSNSTAYVLIV